MESSSSQSVNPIPSWGNSNRNQSTRTSDPMAFFDLIMDSARSSLGQGGKSLDPTATTAPASPSQDSGYAASTDDDQWHDGQQDSSTAAYAAATPTSPEVNNASDVDDQQLDADDAAAVVELKSDESPQEDSSNEPDQAALETAAAASQSEQLLGAPDTLETDAEATEIAGEQAAVKESKSTQPVAQTTTQPVDTDQPLDMSEEAREGEDALADVNGTKVDETTIQDAAKEEEPKTEEIEEATLEVEVTDATSDAVDEQADRDVEATERPSEEIEADLAAGVEEAAAEQDAREDSTRDSSGSSRTRKVEKAESNPQPSEAVDSNTASATTTSEAGTQAAEAIAVSNVATTTTDSQGSSSGGTTSSTGNNATNIATLLQRGLQRGTLQKSTEGKPATQLDAKQQIRLINRVARAVETTPAGQSIKIRLNPSELGQLKVEIKVEGGNMIAKIEAENPATRQVLLQHLPQLRERLAESNINVQQFDVDVMGQQSSTDGGAANLADQQTNNGNSSGGSRQWASSSSGSDESEMHRTEQVNKEAERDSRNLNVTV